MLEPLERLLLPIKRPDKRRTLDLIGKTSLFAAGCLIMALLLMAHRPWPLDVPSAGGMLLVSALAMLLMRFHITHVPLNATTPRKAELVIGITAMLAVGGVQLMTRGLGPQELSGVGFLLTAPLAGLAMLLSALLGPSLAMFALTMVAFLLGLAKALPIDLVATSWLAGAVGAHAVNPLKARGDLLRAMTILAAFQALVACCVMAMATPSLGLVLESAGWAALSGFGAISMFWMMVAVFERIFGIVSDWSLLELSSPEHPLLRELCLRAPGTYAHSVMVANLAENAAREVGANPVLCRAMAYFHDVGKSARPSYFIENQIVHQNPHDNLSPSLSAMILSAHVKEGLELAKKHRLPQPIQDAIAQHHGTSLISFFYNRAVQGQPDTSGLESFFRYPGPKPQTKEVAILSLADSVEAASRAIAAGSEELEIAIAKLFEERRADGQLDECDLTLRDLQTIQKSFVRSLAAIRHERVVYPNMESDEASSHLAHQALPGTDSNSNRPQRA